MKSAVRGQWLAIASVLIWSLFPVFAVLSLKDLPPLIVAAISALLASGFFAVVVTFERGWIVPSRQAYYHIARATLLIGVIYYALLFTGYKFTTANNGSIIMLMEIFFSFLIISIITRHEKFMPMQAVGAGLMICGALFILIPKASGWHWGDFIILLAAAVPPLGNVSMQQARKEVSASFIMFWRSSVSCVALFALSFLFESLPSLAHLHAAIPALLMSGVLLLGFSRILWIEAIHRIPITQTISLASIQPAFTMIFAWLLLKERVTTIQLFSFPLIAAGIFVLLVYGGIKNVPANAASINS